MSVEVRAEERRSGLTPRTVAAIIYSSLILQPAVIWLTLAAGINLGASLAMCITILIVELTALSGKELTPQELWTIYLTSAQSGIETVMFNILFQTYVRKSPMTLMFKTPTGEPMINAIPDWYAPPPNSPGVLHRNIWSPEFFMPVMVLALGTFIIMRVIGIGLGFYMHSIYVVQENLPFPQIQMYTESLESFLDRKGSRFRVLVWMAVIGFIYGTVLYGLPLLSKGVIRPIPIPWADATPLFEPFVPGIIVGMATDIFAFAFAFMIPFNVLVCIIIGSFAIYLIANPVLVKMYPGGLFDWSPGMSAILIYQWSTLYVWASFLIGMTIGAGLYPLIRRPQVVINGFKSILRPATKETAKIRTVSLAMFFGGCIALIALNYYLVPVPELLPWITLLVVGGTFVMTVIGGRALGESGMAFANLYFREATLLASGYQGVDIWFAPLNITMSGGYWASFFKGCDITRTTYLSLVAATMIATATSYVVSLIFSGIFWSMAEIPSETYPATIVFWPVQTIMTLIWPSRAMNVFYPSRIILGLVLAVVLGIIGDITHLPISVMGLAIGFSSPTPTALSLLIGGIVGKVMERQLGKKWWAAHKSVIVGGLLLGEGVAVSLYSAISIIRTALWALPF